MLPIKKGHQDRIFLKWTGGNDCMLGIVGRLWVVWDAADYLGHQRCTSAASKQGEDGWRWEPGWVGACLDVKQQFLSQGVGLLLLCHLLPHYALTAADFDGVIGETLPQALRGGGERWGAAHGGEGQRNMTRHRDCFRWTWGQIAS
eukprot:1159330-Pelagomonas_calceolata.AAC.9